MRLRCHLLVLALLACSTPPAEPAPSNAPAREVAPIEAEPGDKPESTVPPPAAKDEAKAPDAKSPDGKEPPGQQTEVRAGNDPCKTDADCVRGACCHADSCVAKSKAPSCKDAVCTLECRAATMDCGGGCLCLEGKCAAKVVMSFD